MSDDDLVTLAGLLTTARDDMKTALMARKTAADALAVTEVNVRKAKARLDAVRARVVTLLESGVELDPEPPIQPGP